MLIKVGSNICPTLNKPSHSCLRLLKYSQNGEISAKSGHTALRTFYLDNVRPPSTFLPLGQILKQKRRQTLSRKTFFFFFFAVICAQSFYRTSSIEGRKVLYTVVPHGLLSCFITDEVPGIFSRKTLFCKKYKTNTIEMLDADSVTRWLDYFSIFGHLQQCKIMS